MNIDIDLIYDNIVKYYSIDDYDSIFKECDKILNDINSLKDIKIDIILFIYIKIKWEYYRLYDIYKIIKLLKSRNKILYRFALNIIFENNNSKLGSEIILYKKNSNKSTFIDTLIYIYYLKKNILNYKSIFNYKIYIQKIILYARNKINELNKLGNTILECKFYENFIFDIEKHIYNNSYKLLNQSSYRLFNFFITNIENNKYMMYYKYYEELLDKPTEINSYYLHYYKFIYEIRNGLHNKTPDLNELINNILSHNELDSTRFNTIILIHRLKLLISVILYCKINNRFNYDKYLLIIKNIRNRIIINKYNTNYILFIDYYIALLSKEYNNIIKYGEQIVNINNDVLLCRDKIFYIELLYAYYHEKEYDKYISFFETNKIIMYNKLINSQYYIKLILLDINYRLLNKQVTLALNLCTVPTHVSATYETLDDYNSIYKMKQLINKKIATLRSYNLRIIDNICETKGLYNEDNKIVCSICYDEVTKPDISLVECTFCNKYIGHVLCIYRWIEQLLLLNKNPSCHICSHSFMIE